MNRNLFRSAAISLLTFSALLCAYSQGLYWESKTSGMPGGMKERTDRFYFMPKMFKVIADGGKGATICRLDKQLIITVDDEERTYSEITFEELEGVMKKAASMIDDPKMAEMKKGLENLPPEQRKMMEQMLGDKLGAKKKDSKIEVNKTGSKKTISGYACTQYIIKQDGKELVKLWVTKDIKGFEQMAKDFEEFGRRMAALNPMGAKELAENMKKIEGFPVQTIMGDITTTVTKVEKQSTPAAEFEPPAGCTKVKSKMLGPDKPE